MSLFTFITKTDDLVPLLRRTAEALERIAPEPEAAADVAPAEAVTYVDEEAQARAEAIRELGVDAERLAQWQRDHPDEAEEMSRDAAEAEVWPRVHEES